MREQKLEEQRLHQEERMKRALERAQADAKKNVSKKLLLIALCFLLLKHNLNLIIKIFMF